MHDCYINIYVFLIKCEVNSITIFKKLINNLHQKKANAKEKDGLQRNILNEHTPKYIIIF